MEWPHPDKCKNTHHTLWRACTVALRAPSTNQRLLCSPRLAAETPVAAPADPRLGEYRDEPRTIGATHQLSRNSRSLPDSVQRLHRRSPHRLPRTRVPPVTPLSPTPTASSDAHLARTSTLP